MRKMKAIRQIAARKDLRNVGMLGGGQRRRRDRLECPRQLLRRPRAGETKIPRLSGTWQVICASASASSEGNREMWKSIGCPGQSRAFLSRKEKLSSDRSASCHCDLAGLSHMPNPSIHNVTSMPVGDRRCAIVPQTEKEAHGHRIKASGQSCIPGMIFQEGQELKSRSRRLAAIDRGLPAALWWKKKRIAYAATFGAHLHPFRWSHSRGLRCAINHLLGPVNHLLILSVSSSNGYSTYL